ncbi:MAG: hypothetical protein KDK41_13735 [Leptospiraceae bacterium]|nr:hypothetical protein [Leptospiraceae bacterium]MCB1201703.1 hypothetical protein [Leptospiraceae bacterium]
MKLTKQLLILTAGAFLLHCSMQHAYVVESREELSEAFSTVSAKLAQLDYNITNANEKAGFIMAERQTSGAAIKILAGSEEFDVLSVSITRNSTGKANVRVKAATQRLQTNQYGMTGSRSTIIASEQVQKNAQEILSMFGGKIVKVEDR